MTNINFNEPSMGDINSNNEIALKIKSSGINGVCLSCESTNDNGGEGIIGKSKISIGVKGESIESEGVMGTSTKGIGVSAIGPIGVQALGVEPNNVGIHAEALNGIGVHALGKVFGVQAITHYETGTGVYGISSGTKGIGVLGQSVSWFGVHGISDQKDGVWGESHSDHGSGVVGFNDHGGPGIFGKGNLAGRFEGDVEIIGNIRGDLSVLGDIKLLNADCAEDFDIIESEIDNVEAGTVMVLTANGSLRSSYQEYDKKVAGIVSGASGYKPGIILDSQRVYDQKNKKERLPLALMGKVYCKVDANQSPIEIGDLLTTSSTNGHAMKAEDPVKSFGAVIGKALGSIQKGTGMLPVLVALH